MVLRTMFPAFGSRWQRAENIIRTTDKPFNVLREVLLFMHGIYKSLTFVLFLAGYWGAPNLAAAVQTTACEIQVVEKDSGWPVPMVELQTTHLEKFVTDNAGRVAFDL